MTSYFRCFLKYARYKAAAAVAMMVLVGLLEGSGLLVLLPLLSLLGLGEGHPDNFVATAIPDCAGAVRPVYERPVVACAKRMRISVSLESLKAFGVSPQGPRERGTANVEKSSFFNTPLA
jgi:hypothetical protein